MVNLELGVWVVAVALGELRSEGGGSEGATGLSNWLETSVMSLYGHDCKLGVSGTVGRRIIPL